MLQVCSLCNRNTETTTLTTLRRCPRGSRGRKEESIKLYMRCLLYTSDAADE